MLIRHARPDDDEGIWEILEAVVRAGETFALPRDIGREEALAFWNDGGRQVFVAEEERQIVGTYYVRPNQSGGGSHVANGGYATRVTAQGKGIARAMLEHSLSQARAAGFRAMQFNFVVSTNERAVKTWLAYGFEIVGRLPGAFRHPHLGFVDAFVMFKEL